MNEVEPYDISTPVDPVALAYYEGFLGNAYRLRHPLEVASIEAELAGVNLSTPMSQEDTLHQMYNSLIGILSRSITAVGLNCRFVDMTEEQRSLLKDYFKQLDTEAARRLADLEDDPYMAILPNPLLNDRILNYFGHEVDRNKNVPPQVEHRTARRLMRICGVKPTGIEAKNN